MNMHCAVIVAILAVCDSVMTGFAQETSDATLARFAQERTNAVRITSQPVKMWDRVAFLCGIPVANRRVLEKTNALGQPLSVANPHEHKYAHVFVSSNGSFAMKTNSATFPVGSIIIKEKFSDPNGKETELFTGMIKREKGYNPACGDWEFFTLSAEATKVTARGKLKSCMDCHVEYAESDFVTKKYVTFSH